LESDVEAKVAAKGVCCRCGRGRPLLKNARGGRRARPLCGRTARAAAALTCMHAKGGASGHLVDGRGLPLTVGRGDDSTHCPPTTIRPLQPDASRRPSVYGHDERVVARLSEPSRACRDSTCKAAVQSLARDGAVWGVVNGPKRGNAEWIEQLQPVAHSLLLQAIGSSRVIDQPTKELLRIVPWPLGQGALKV